MTAQVPESEYRCVSFANLVAGELGMFGLRPEVCCSTPAGTLADEHHKLCILAYSDIAVICGTTNLLFPVMQVMSDVLAGKRVDVSVGESAYWRTFGGDQSPEDLETALQLVYRQDLTPVLLPSVDVIGFRGADLQMTALCHRRLRQLLMQVCLWVLRRLFTESVEPVESRLDTCRR